MRIIDKKFQVKKQICDRKVGTVNVVDRVTSLQRHLLLAKGVKTSQYLKNIIWLDTENTAILAVKSVIKPEMEAEERVEFKQLWIHFHNIIKPGGLTVCWIIDQISMEKMTKNGQKNDHPLHYTFLIPWFKRWLNCLKPFLALLLLATAVAGLRITENLS